MSFGPSLARLQARNLKKGERLSPEQADALARRARGTARDYWKDWVDVQGKYTDKGYVAEGVSNTAGPVAVAGSLVVLGLIAFIALEFA